MMKCSYNASCVGVEPSLGSKALASLSRPSEASVVKIFRSACRSKSNGIAFPFPLRIACVWGGAGALKYRGVGIRKVHLSESFRDCTQETFRLKGLQDRKSTRLNSSH